MFYENIKIDFFSQCSNNYISLCICTVLLLYFSLPFITTCLYKLDRNQIQPKA